MSNLLPQFAQYKTRIPEFIVKLYHILEQPEYSDYLSWHQDSEIYIKNVKKVEERVLPHFFRHKRMSSFVRQLNMYRFSKVNKLTKERNAMYFKNDNFKRGNIPLLTRITRNHKKQRDEDEQDSPQQYGDSPSEPSIHQELQANTPLTQYKAYVKQKVAQIMRIIHGVESFLPVSKNQLWDAIVKCNQLLEMPSESRGSSLMSLESSLENKNMMSTMKLLPGESIIPIAEPMLFPSQCSFFHIN